MKPISTVNDSSNDGTLIQKVVKRGLISLSVAIILLSSTALWTVVQLTDFYKNKVHVIAEQDKLLHTMSTAGRERTLLLYAMVTEQDPFQNDENRMAFYSAGTKFAQARLKLIKYPLTNNELQMLEYQGKLTGVNRPIQEQVVDLVTDGEAKLALELLREQAISGQKIIEQSLDKLGSSIEIRKNIINVKAGSIGKASIIVIISIVIIIIIGALYIIRQTTRRSFNLISQLTQTRQMLHRTISELVQQKDTLDQHAIVSITDSEGDIIYINDKFSDVSGFSRDELIGKNHRMLKSDEHSEEFYQNLWDTISQGNVWQGKICNKRKDGGLFWVESTISPFLDDKGIPYQYVAIRTDITHLLEAKIEAVAANKAKSQFLSSMSHELRTPLNAVIGFGQLLETRSKDGNVSNEVIQKYSNNILQGGNQLLGLINEVLDFSRIDSGHLKIDLEPVLLTKLITECIEQINVALADKHNITLIDKNSYLDIKVLADTDRLRQIILNLLSNAVKYNREGGSVTIETKLSDQEHLRICVVDTGKGIAANDIDKLFDPFERLTFKHGQIEGSGIGLTVTKQLIDAMGGIIGVESTLNKGSTFWIELPIAKHIDEAMEAESTALPESHSPKNKNETKHTVLYIEDNPINAQLMEDVLNNKGNFEFLTSLTAEDGLTLAEEKIPDIILMDIHLPGMDGITALKILRSVETTKNIPVIAVSGAAMDNDIKAGEAAGFNDYLTKPFDFNRLYAVIEKELADSTTS